MYIREVYVLRGIFNQALDISERKFIEALQKLTYYYQN